MNVVVKFLVVSVPIFVPKSGRVGILEDFFLQIRLLATGFSWKTANLTT